MAKLNLSSIAELTLELCNIESVSGNERAIADAIEQTLRQYPHLEILRDGDALIARTTLGRKHRVIIAGHLDTVPVADNLPARLMSFEREQVILGRGSVDMKGGIAVMLKLACELDKPDVDISWVFYDHEEVAAEKNGLGRLSKNHPELLAGDFAVLCEPTGATIEGGCNGTMRVELILSGKKAHSARPWMGDNAIHKAADILQILKDFSADEIMVDGLGFRESLSAVGISGGIAGNVIPDSATITVNYRFAPAKSVADAEKYLRELFVGCELRVVDSAAGARPGLDTELAKQFVASVGTSVAAKYGWTDVARFSALGIASVNYGPGDPNRAHADDEGVVVGQLEACEAGLRKWLS